MLPRKGSPSSWLSAGESRLVYWFLLAFGAISATFAVLAFLGLYVPSAAVPSTLYDVQTKVDALAARYMPCYPSGLCGVDLYVFDLFSDATVSRSDVEAVVAATQEAANRDFASMWWGLRPNLVLLPRGVVQPIPPASLALYLVDNLADGSNVFAQWGVASVAAGNPQPNTFVDYSLPSLADGQAYGAIMYGSASDHKGLAWRVANPSWAGSGNRYFGASQTTDLAGLSLTFSSLAWTMMTDRKSTGFEAIEPSIRPDAYQMMMAETYSGAVAWLGDSNVYHVQGLPIANFVAPSYYFNYGSGVPTGARLDFLGQVNEAFECWGGQQAYIATDPSGCQIYYVNVSHWWDPAAQFTAFAYTLAGPCTEPAHARASAKRTSRALL